MLLLQGRIPEILIECIKNLPISHPRATVSVEVEKPGRLGLQELAAEADVVFYSKTWAQVRFCFYMPRDYTSGPLMKAASRICQRSGVSRETVDAGEEAVSLAGGQQSTGSTD